MVFLDRCSGSQYIPALPEVIELAVLILILLLPRPGFADRDDKVAADLPEQVLFRLWKRIGRLENPQLVECSGIAASSLTDGLLWAINDGGNGPYLFALDSEGRDLGRVRVNDTENHDWEGIDTFVLGGEAFILIADVGDNFQKHNVHTLYIVKEPHLTGKPFEAAHGVDQAWRIAFRYPDKPHDAEAVAVDSTSEKILILTKRDNPPILFVLPLLPPAGNGPVKARELEKVTHIPPPAADDLQYPFGVFRSQPTAMDLDPQNGGAIVLTYKDAVLFRRLNGRSWSSAFGGSPRVIRLPLPNETRDLRQREAICFSRDGRSLIVTSEGLGAGIYRRSVR